jgi:hypothetical protein
LLYLARGGLKGVLLSGQGSSPPRAVAAGGVVAAAASTTPGRPAVWLKGAG